MNLNPKVLGIGIIIAIIIIAAAVILTRPETESSRYDNFAKCLAEKGAIMYGAFWCGHCQNQKAEFGSSFQYINYTECTVDGKRDSFTQVCQDAGIQSYPTWKFPDGTVKVGEASFDELAKLSGCTLPQE